MLQPLKFPQIPPYNRNSPTPPTTPVHHSSITPSSKPISSQHKCSHNLPANVCSSTSRPPSFCLLAVVTLCNTMPGRAYDVGVYVLSRLPISERPRRAREGMDVGVRAWGGSWGSGFGRCAWAAEDGADVVVDVEPLVPARCVAIASARERRNGDLTHLATCALARRARRQKAAGDAGGKEGRVTVKYVSARNQYVAGDIETGVGERYGRRLIAEYIILGVSGVIYYCIGILMNTTYMGKFLPSLMREAIRAHATLHNAIMALFTLTPFRLHAVKMARVCSLLKACSMSRVRCRAPRWIRGKTWSPISRCLVCRKLTLHAARARREDGVAVRVSNAGGRISGCNKQQSMRRRARFYALSHSYP